LLFGLLLLAAPGRADLIQSLATGAQLAGATVTVTFTNGGPMTTATIIDNGGGQGFASSADGSFTFSVTGNTFTNSWTLTNNTSGNAITSVVFDLSGSIFHALFDTTSHSAVCGPEGPTYNCGTWASDTGEPGALWVSGPTILASSAEFSLWPGVPALANAGDMFLAEQINFGGSGLTTTAPAVWYDDTDLYVVPEPASFFLGGIGLFTAYLWRRRALARG